MKNIFSTTEVSRILKVSQRQVCKWIDAGKLRAYRIPGSQQRRVPREHLKAFLEAHGMPTDELGDDPEQGSAVPA